MRYVDAPVYFEYVPGQYITYWFFYGYNFSPGPRRFPLGNITRGYDHQGDWERVSIQLDGNVPMGVAFYTHSKSCWVSWSAVERQSGRPVVYSAIGSHASWPHARDDWPTEASEFRVRDRTGRGAQWWADQNLRDVRAERWYGFGGAWGQARSTGHNTGPDGPSPYKGGRPDWPGEDCQPV